MSNFIKFGFVLCDDTAATCCSSTNRYHTIFGNMIAYVGNITHVLWGRCKFLELHPHKLHLLYSCPIISILDVYFVMILLLHAVPAPIWYHTIFGKMITYEGNITHFQWR